MLEVIPRIHANIERLSVKMRNMAGLNSADASRLHVTPEGQINSPNQLVRYNIRQQDGTIRKLTIFDTFIKEEILAKKDNSYQRISKKRIKI